MATRTITPPPTLPPRGAVQEMAEVLQNLPRVMALGFEAPGGPTGGVVAAISEQTKLVSLKEYIAEYAPKPDRRTGEVVVRREEDFLRLAQAYLDKDRTLVTVVSAPGERGADCLRVVATINYHNRGEGMGHLDGEWGDFVIAFRAEISAAFRAWQVACAQWMATKTFAEFAEERMRDLASGDDDCRWIAEQAGLHLGTPVEIIAASRGLHLTVKKTVRDVVYLNDGGMELEYTETGTPNVVVPGMAAIEIPLWENGPKVTVPVRIRYRTGSSGGVEWRLALWAIEDICTREVASFVERLSTALPVPVVVGAVTLSPSQPNP